MTDDAPDVTERVLPLVVRIERATPPMRTDALEAAARAVLLLLTDDRPEWQEAVSQWDGQRIRKVVRRARGAEWRRARERPGLTGRHETAQIRVYPPIPIDGWPRDLARLQVGGTDLTDDAAPLRTPHPDAPLILLSPYEQLTAGKAMAQAAHASQLGWRATCADRRADWRAADFPLAVRTATPARWTRAVRDGAPVVRDAGFTEVTPGTATALIVLPWA